MHNRNSIILIGLPICSLSPSPPPPLQRTDPPEIIKRPSNQAVRVGGVASFYCAARGDPVPSIVWRKSGKKVSGTQTRYSVSQINGQSILRIEPVRAGRDEAPYECVAENGVGDAVSAEASLSVYEGMLDFRAFFFVLGSFFVVRLPL